MLLLASSTGKCSNLGKANSNVVLLTGNAYRFLLRATDYQDNEVELDQLPENKSVDGIAGGIAQAYKLYNVPRYEKLAQCNIHNVYA